MRKQESRTPIDNIETPRKVMKENSRGSPRASRLVMEIKPWKLARTSDEVSQGGKRVDTTREDSYTTGVAA